MWKCIPLLIAATAAHAQPEIGGCPVFPANNVWNTSAVRLPADRNSPAYIKEVGEAETLKAGFSRERSGIPVVVVGPEQPKVKAVVQPGNALAGLFPIPADAPVDAEHKRVLVLQRGTCMLYELSGAAVQKDRSWTFRNGAFFDLRWNLMLPENTMSADAAGLPILPGLVRYDEVKAGEIQHVLRMTAPRIRQFYTWPARRSGSQDANFEYPPMGQRFRLKRDFDISGFDKDVQVILKALKDYGAMLADPGPAWTLSGAPDPRWDETALAQLAQIKGSDMEAVDVSQLMVSYLDAQAGIPAAVRQLEVPFSATPSFDVGGASVISLKLAGDVTRSTIANLVDGQNLSFVICQDERGGWRFVWPENVAGGMTIGSKAGGCSAQSFVSDGQRLYATTPGVADLPPNAAGRGK